MKTHQAAKRELISLFEMIGQGDEVRHAFDQECRNACLHGLVDGAYDEWGDACDFLDILAERWEVKPSTVDEANLNDEFSSSSFRDDSDWGLQVLRGRLFSLRDFQIAKECIAALDPDRFSQDFQSRYGKPVPVNSHLWRN